MPTHGRGIVLVSLVFLSLGGAAAQQSSPQPPTATPSVTVPIFPNVNCPIMGKPISTKLFTDTEFGRIYICCKSCIADIRAEPEVAYKAAYPTVRTVGNDRCPVTRRPIEAGAPTLSLQGRSFSVCSERCVSVAREEAQVTLAKLDAPTLVDVGNERCPISGTPTVANAFCVVDGHLVRLSSPRMVASVEKDPAGALARAKELAARPERGAAGKPPEGESTERRGG